MWKHNKEHLVIQQKCVEKNKLFRLHYQLKLAEDAQQSIVL